MRLCVTVEQAADHSLVLGTVFLCLALEKVYATPGKRDRDLYCLFPKRKLLRSREKVTDHPQSA